MPTMNPSLLTLGLTLLPLIAGQPLPTPVAPAPVGPIIPPPVVVQLPPAASPVVNPGIPPVVTPGATAAPGVVAPAPSPIGPGGCKTISPTSLCKVPVLLYAHRCMPAAARCGLERLCSARGEHVVGDGNSASQTTLAGVPARSHSARSAY
ncbi:uncharacterized protein EV422DRAFT_505880 [Fimicolochytrium jonesii]|uniref:uncharacterized protein n=1 Tax=Fimicolochytrium jonesii TaxID=1396493 RepID=UPI0022FEA6AE|nr:uncharacterized protein EV422DRAFT_505880 [Fimicolochytrium jonesii]KAI8821785.1 hypothetical protein EV422DRAFT_505880 [Fimicolochytrium jonesii]